MAKVILVNPSCPYCGVYQFGINLFEVLNHSKKHLTMCMRFDEWDLLREVAVSWPADVILWNWSPLIQTGISTGPPDWCRNILVRHERHDQDFRYDRIIFADPTQPDNDLVKHIGRPLPHWTLSKPRAKHDRMWIGVHGFNGAWASQMVSEIASKNDISNITFRLHLPNNPYVDPNGHNAEREADVCQRLAAPRGGQVEVTREDKSMRDLLDWLSENDVNCYVRHKVPWFGVSSALDAALAVDVPIAINQCWAFRHMFDCQPSICLEDRTLKEIIDSSIEPLIPKKRAWSQANVLAQVEKVIDEVV